MKGCFGKYSCNSSTCYMCEDEPECIDNTLNILVDEIKQENKRISKSEYYLEIAKAASKRSTCLKRHYGAIIVKNDEIIATGYNGSPRGCVNCSDIGKCKRLDKPHNSGDYSDCHSVHEESMEMNYPEPCPICARMLLNAGIKFVATKERLLRVKDYI